jgi:hypothetical protein
MYRRIIILKLGVPGSTGLGNSVALTTVQDQVVCPVDGRIVSVKCVGLGKAGTTDPTMDIYKNGATILSAVMTIAANATTYTGTIAGGVTGTAAQTLSGVKVAVGDIITLRCFTHATGGQLITPSMTVMIAY